LFRKGDFVKKLYVGNLPFTSKEDQLQSFFETYGPVTSVTIITDRETGRSRGFGFVEFEKDEDAARALTSANEKELGGRKLNVREAHDKVRR
jgi:RNA recognition motif-containing protein